MEEPFHSSNWETFAPNSTIKGLPRPVEEYQAALRELMDAASKASMLFDEFHSFCYRSDPNETNADPVNCSKSSMPPDVLHIGQAYQEFVPRSLQVIYKLADKASACSFSQDPSDPTKSSNPATLGFHKSNDYGMFKFIITYLCDRAYNAI